MAESRSSHDSVLVEIISTPLVLAKYAEWVGDPSAGAVATFTGTTRNTFDGKAVERLEYEAYVPMAMAKLDQLCQEALRKWPLIKITVAHRIGTVGVGEPSVLIAASSAHRRAALEAVHWAIDELKATVPIWKKEFFEDGQVWKENAESRARLLHATTT
jgi:molybdopterin synthase catalytic subunit